MKALFVMMNSVEDLTSAVIRNLAVIRGLVLEGYDVTLLCLEKSSGSVSNNIGKYPFLNKVRIIRIPQSSVREKIWEDPKKRTIKARIVNSLRKVYHAFSILGSTKGLSKNIRIDILDGVEKYDVTISSSDPKTAHIAVEKLIKQGLRTSKWIQYWGDPLLLDMTRKSICPDLFVKICEKKLIKGADSIIYVSPFTLKLQQDLFCKYAPKMKWLPIPYVEEKISRRIRKENESYTISYIGNYRSDVRNIIPFYDAVSALDKNSRTFIIGDGEPELKETEYIKVIRRSEVDLIENESDLLVTILNRSGSQIPGKVYHQAATDKPILIILDGDDPEKMKGYLQSFDRFYFCKNNKNDILNEICKIRNSNMNFFPCEYFEPSRIVKEMIL